MVRFWRDPLFWLLFAALGLTIGLNAARLQHYSLAEKGQGALQYPATDWVRWQNDADGVRAAAVLPPGRPERLAQSDYIRPGDRLLSIDYRTIGEATTARTIARSVSPGTVLLYQIERPSPNNLQPQKHNFFVIASYKPAFLQETSSLLWHFSLGASLLFSLIALLLLILLLPFLRADFRANLPVFLLLSFAFGLLTLISLRYGLLLVDSRYELLFLERYLASGQALLWLGYALILWLLSLRPQRTGWLALLPPAAGGLLVFGFYQLQLWQTGEYAAYASWIENALASFYALSLSIFFLVQPYHSATLSGRLVRGLFTGIAVLLWAIFLLRQWPAWAGGIASPWFDFLLELTFILPIAYSTGTILRFGKVSLVMTRSLLYLVGFALLVLVYLLLHQLLGDLASAPLTRGLLEVTILAVLALATWLVLQRYRSRIRRYIVLPQQRREEQLEQFINQIPRYTNSQELVAATEDALKSFFQTDYCEVWPGSKGRTEQYAPERLTQEETEQVIAALQPSDAIWAASKELSPLTMQAGLEQTLLEQQIRLIIPLRFSSGQAGMILLGKPKRRVYNFRDLEIVMRIAQQTQLSLEVLHLLEKEKVLMEKTMEANLTALRSQINPHFLFNTLNTISALIHDAPAQAEEAVEKLALIFRHTLKFSKENFVSVGTEMQLVRNYLAIEQIRFGDRLQTDLTIEPGTEEIEIPTLVLQTIVENCIKHGIAKILEPGYIAIDIWRESENTLICRVFDNGPGIDPAQVREGRGLKNVLLRLEELYGSQEVIQFANTGNGTRVTLRTPIRTEHTP